jgi:hypothetical protein
MRSIPFTALMALCVVGTFSNAGAAPLPTPVIITVDENGNGTAVFPGQTPILLPGTLLADPGPGGLASALTYNLGGPPALVAGDVLVQELLGADLILSDIIRFNPAGTGGGFYPASLVFYSDKGDGVDSLADTGFPTVLYTNTVTQLEIGPEGNNGLVYTPTENQPGFVDGFAVSYNIISDNEVVPEPASISLFVLAGGLLLARKRFMKRA